jgi:hypothetical protein
MFILVNLCGNRFSFFRDRHIKFFLSVQNQLSHGALPSTLTPILRAVPATIRMALSTVKQFRSGILSFAIASTWVQLTLPTLLRFGSLDPLCNLAASRIWTAAGGVLIINSKDLSE